MKKIITTYAALVAACALSAGCASFSSDGGFGKVSELTRERTGLGVAWQRDAADADSARARTAELLARPLTAESAVEVALLNNRGLQADLAELGIAEADFVRAGRLANPSIGFGRLSGGGSTDIDRSVLFNVLGLLTFPMTRQIEQRRFEQVQYEAASASVGIAFETRRAFFTALAARELVTYYAQVKEAADASGELARRMLAAGNFSKLSQLREQAFSVDAATRLASATHRAVAEREALARLLGIPGEVHRDAASAVAGSAGVDARGVSGGKPLAFALPERLPDLQAVPVELGAAEQAAVDKRLDVMLAKRRTEATASALSLVGATRFVNVLDIGYANKSQSGQARQSGYQVSLELPLFDFGVARNARAQATYMQAVDRTAQVAINAQSQVREAYSAYRTAYDMARLYRDEVVPMRARISKENMLRYNGMLLSVFDLLADSREQILSVAGAIESLRDAWIADANLQASMLGVGYQSSIRRPEANQ